MEHRLPFSMSAAGEARRLSRDFLHSRLDEARTTDFLMMVSETVGNAVCHGRPELDGCIGLRLDADANVLRAAVSDAAPEFEFEPKILDRANLNHFGLQLVDGLADRWGLTLEGKKAVWFEVDR